MHVQKYSVCLLISSVLPISSLVTFATGFLLSLFSSEGEEIIVTHKVTLPQNKICLKQMEYKWTLKNRKGVVAWHFSIIKYSASLAGKDILNSSLWPGVDLFPEKIIVFTIK